MTDGIEVGGSDCPFENEPYEMVKFGWTSTELAEGIKWCEENCKGKWHIGLPNPFWFKFTNKEDAMAFKLRWS